jgi:hypothetical protein
MFVGVKLKKRKSRILSTPQGNEEMTPILVFKGLYPFEMNPIL